LPSLAKISMYCSIPTHANNELDTAIQTSSRRAQTLSRRSATLAGRFAQAVQQITLYVLPDFDLAMKEKEPALLTSLIAMLDGRLVELRAQGEDMQREHVELQSHVQGLISSTQRHKPDRGFAFAEALLLMKVEKQVDSPRSVQTSSTEYESSGNGDQSADDGDLSSDDGYQPCDFKEGGILNTTSAVASNLEDGKASPLKGLEVLKKMDQIVEVDLGFWRDVIETLQQLTQMQQHISCLIQCVSSSPRLRARAEQRLDEYSSTWSSLERACQQHVAEHEKSESPLHVVSVEVEEASDRVSAHKTASIAVSLGVFPNSSLDDLVP